MRRVGGEFLDVDARLEPLALGAENHAPHVAVFAGRAQRVGQLEPTGDRQRVHGWVVDRDDLDVVAAFGANHVVLTFT